MVPGMPLCTFALKLVRIDPGLIYVSVVPFSAGAVEGPSTMVRGYAVNSSGAFVITAVVASAVSFAVAMGGTYSDGSRDILDVSVSRVLCE